MVHKWWLASQVSAPRLKLFASTSQCDLSLCGLFMLRALCWQKLLYSEQIPAHT